MAARGNVLAQALGLIVLGVIFTAARQKGGIRAWLAAKFANAASAK